MATITDPTAVLAVIAAFGAVFAAIGIISWIYLSLAFTAIGKKANLSNPALAWIPGVGPLILSYQASKMHWWPWILLVLSFIPFLGFVTGLVFTVYAMIWQWKLLETVGKPGWWVLLALIPGVGSLVYLILIGIAAWSSN